MPTRRTGAAFAAEDPADQFLRLRLRLLRQPRVQQCAPRAFTVDEVVRLTLDLYRRNCIEGLFLSSGITRSEDDTMEDLMRVAQNLRRTTASAAIST